MTDYIAELSELNEKASKDRIHYDRPRKSPRSLHQMSGTPTYRTWADMKRRCLSNKSTHFKHYGGRGIKVCDKWLEFKGFYEDMGDRPEGCSLDRIDVNGHYELSNCRWSTWVEQQQNRRPTSKNGAHKKRDNWSARVAFNDEDIYLGAYRSAEAASAMYEAAKSIIKNLPLWLKLAEALEEDKRLASPEYEDTWAIMHPNTDVALRELRGK